MPTQDTIRTGWSLAERATILEPTPSIQEIWDRDRPTPEDFLKTCMRGREIASIEEGLKGGQGVFLYGGDGFGKTTLLSELGRYLELEGYILIDVSYDTFREPEYARAKIAQLQDIKWGLEKGLLTRAKVCVLSDSADYIWEDVALSVTSSEGQGELRKLRMEILELLLEPGMPVVATLHNEAADTKQKDPMLESLVKGRIAESCDQGNIQMIELGRLYDEDRVGRFLESHGVHPAVVDALLVWATAREHVLLANYMFAPEMSGHWRLLQVYGELCADAEADEELASPLKQRLAVIVQNFLAAAQVNRKRAEKMYSF